MCDEFMPNLALLSGRDKLLTGFVQIPEGYGSPGITFANFTCLECHANRPRS